MRILILLCIVLMISTDVLGCGRRRCGRFRRRRGKCGVGGKGPVGDVIQRKYDNPSLSPYSPRGDSPGDCNQLKCNLDDQGNCCWSNAVPQADELNFVRGTGPGEPTKMQEHFGTTTSPSGNFFIVASDEGGTAEQSAQLFSCPITCTEGDITVKVKHWQTKGTKIQVCTEPDPKGPPQNCKDLPETSGNADQVTIPKGQNVRVVIQAKGFTDPTGTVAMIDDIEVQCEICKPSTPAPAPPSPVPVPDPTPPPAPPCKQINCDFEHGNPCAYQPASTGGAVNNGENWGVHRIIYQNRLTGIEEKSPDGDNFGACYLKKKADKAILSTNADFPSSFFVKFFYYKATEGITFKMCCNDEMHCPKQASGDVKTSDYRHWNSESVQCPAGTKKILFVCTQEKGENEGACGVDKIQLIQNCGADAGKCSTACPNSDK